jgi:hypothetical protein
MNIFLIERQKQLAGIVTEGSVIVESKQTIVNLGYPEILATFLQEKFGQKAFLIAKWLKEYSNIHGQTDSNWWRKHLRGITFNRDDPDMVDYVDLYEAGKISQRLYSEVRAKLELGRSKDTDPNSEEPVDFSKLSQLKADAREGLFNNIFFKSTFIIDIISGKIKDLKPYKNLTFQQAKDKYDSKRIFDDMQPIKQYENGLKWIDVGSKCQLVGNAMNNCGSTGVMSSDPDRTMLTLFDKNNNPHVVITYSPNDKRLSSDEGKASSAVKDEYHSYVLDLAKHLGANFDVHATKSPSLKMKAILGDKIKSVDVIPGSGLYSYYKLVLSDESVWYSNGYTAAKAHDVVAERKPEDKKEIDMVTSYFAQRNIRNADGVVDIEKLTIESVEFSNGKSILIERWQKLAGII